MTDPTKTLPGFPTVEQDRAELRRLDARVTQLETTVRDLEALLNDAKVDRLVRQFRRLRKYLASWLQED